MNAALKTWGFCEFQEARHPAAHYGTENANAKLKIPDVKLIKRLRGKMETEDIIRLFEDQGKQVTYSEIDSIWRGNTWRHVKI